jgi:hypothetical protein
MQGFFDGLRMTEKGGGSTVRTAYQYPGISDCQYFSSPMGLYS